MPIYEYLCEKCQQEFEREQRISDDPVKTCPNCRSRKVKKLISQTSFVLKGGGWYSEGYASAKKDAKATPGDSEPSSSKSSDAAASSDSGTKSDGGASKDSGGDKPKKKSKGKKSAD